MSDKHLTLGMCTLYSVFPLPFSPNLLFSLRVPHVINRNHSSWAKVLLQRPLGSEDCKVVTFSTLLIFCEAPAS